MTYTGRRTVPVADTLRELRESFRKWEIDLWEAVPLTDNRRGLGGMAVRYYRAGVWQEVRCEDALDKATNLRRCFHLVDRLRLAEAQGVVYSGLTSTRELVRATPDFQRQETELDAYGVLGVSPDDPIDLIEDVYRRKAQYYHPDKGGEPEKFKRIQAAIDTIRGVRNAK